MNMVDADTDAGDSAVADVECGGGNYVHGCCTGCDDEFDNNHSGGVDECDRTGGDCGDDAGDYDVAILMKLMIAMSPIDMTIIGVRHTVILLALAGW